MFFGLVDFDVPTVRGWTFTEFKKYVLEHKLNLGIDSRKAYNKMGGGKSRKRKK